MGRIVGFEPTTAGATDRCSTAELYPPYCKVCSVQPFYQTDAPAGVALITVLVHGTRARTARVAAASAATALGCSRARAGRFCKLPFALDRPHCECRILLFKLRAAARRTLRLPASIHDRFEMFLAILADVLEDRHLLGPRWKSDMLLSTS